MITMSFLYRKHLALKLISPLNINSAIEIGFSDRDILSSTKAKEKIGIDLKDYVCKRKDFKTFNMDEKDFVPKKKVDLVIALEVLEHIPDDLKALKRWNSWLKTDGYLLLSVPAKKKYWDTMDEYAGHKRRYELKELLVKLSKSGFVVDKLYCYGFPIFNITKFIRNALLKRNLKGGKKINPGHSKGFKLLISEIILNPITVAILDCFIKTDLGIGYITLVKKSNHK